ncbi:serine/arginine repetitive matrix protein 1-like [Sycon ciliatum]|uniref:serine/arginine repetitive matrix protein 1-like n=1 Tax=Sycon ciliatum TaxID=27933 RepID=UPI0031F6B905
MATAGGNFGRGQQQPVRGGGGRAHDGGDGGGRQPAAGDGRQHELTDRQPRPAPRRGGQAVQASGSQRPRTSNALAAMHRTLGHTTPGPPPTEGPARAQYLRGAGTPRRREVNPAASSHQERSSIAPLPEVAASSDSADKRPLVFLFDGTAIGPNTTRSSAVVGTDDFDPYQTTHSTSYKPPPHPQPPAGPPPSYQHFNRPNRNLLSIRSTSNQLLPTAVEARSRRQGPLGSQERPPPGQDQRAFHTLASTDTSVFLADSEQSRVQEEAVASAQPAAAASRGMFQTPVQPGYHAVHPVVAEHHDLALPTGRTPIVYDALVEPHNPNRAAAAPMDEFSAIGDPEDALNHRTRRLRRIAQQPDAAGHSSAGYDHSGNQPATMATNPPKGNPPRAPRQGEGSTRIRPARRDSLATMATNPPRGNPPRAPRRGEGSVSIQPAQRSTEQSTLPAIPGTAARQAQPAQITCSVSDLPLGNNPIRTTVINRNTAIRDASLQEASSRGMGAASTVSSLPTGAASQPNRPCVAGAAQAGESTFPRLTGGRAAGRGTTQESRSLLPAVGSTSIVTTTTATTAPSQETVIPAPPPGLPPPGNYRPRRGQLTLAMLGDPKERARAYTRYSRSKLTGGSNRPPQHPGTVEQKHESQAQGTLQRHASTVGAASSGVATMRSLADTLAAQGTTTQYQSRPQAARQRDTLPPQHTASDSTQPRTSSDQEPSPGAAAAAAGTPSAAAAAEATAATTSSVNNVDVRSMQSYQLVTQQEGKVTVKSIRDKRRELRQVKSPFTTRLPKLPQDTVLNRSPLPTQDKDPSPHSTRGSGSEKDEQRTSDHSMADLLAMEDGKAWSLTTQGKLTDQRHQQEAKARQRNEMVQRNKMRPKHQKKDSSGSSDTSVHPSGRKKPDAPRRKPPAKKLANRPVRDTAHKRKVLFPKITQPPKKAWTQQSEKHSKHRLVLPNIHAAKDSSTGSSLSSGHSSVHTSTHGNTGSSSSGF